MRVCRRVYGRVYGLVCAQVPRRALLAKLGELRSAAAGDATSGGQSSVGPSDEWIGALSDALSSLQARARDTPQKCLAPRSAGAQECCHQIVVAPRSVATKVVLAKVVLAHAHTHVYSHVYTHSRLRPASSRSLHN